MLKYEKSFIFLRGNDLWELENQINEKIKEGYEPQGSLTAIMFSSGVRYIQNMYKKNRVEKSEINL